jgi:hypothetical protein
VMKMKRKMISFFIFPSNGAPVEWNWQGKTEILGEKPVPVPLCPPHIPHGLTRHRTQSSAVRGRRLTAWATARPSDVRFCCYNKIWVVWHDNKHHFCCHSWRRAHAGKRLSYTLFVFISVVMMRENTSFFLCLADPPWYSDECFVVYLTKGKMKC